MRFKFCSDGDCPLWALSALHALGSLPAPSFRTLLQHVVEEQNDDGIKEILKDTSLSSRDECARAAAVIRWVLHQTWRAGCAGAHLTRDLLVMGLPRAHAAALADAADTARNTHVSNAQSNGCMVNKVTDASISKGPGGTIDTFTLTLFTDNTLTGDQKKKQLLMEKTQMKYLLVELKKAYNKIEELDKE